MAKTLGPIGTAQEDRDMSGTRSRRVATWTFVIALAWAGAVSVASARSLEDTVKLAVIKKDVSPDFKEERDAGKKIAAYWDYYTGKGYTFGNFRLMSLTGDEVCGWFKRADGPKVDFYYYGYSNGNSNIFTETTHPQIVQSNCHQPHKTTLSGETGAWALSCTDESTDATPRHCFLVAPLPAGGDKATLGMMIVKGDRSHVEGGFFLKVDASRGRRVTMTISGEATSCALVPFFGQEDLFWPCDETTSQRLLRQFVDSKSMKVQFGDNIWEVASDEPHHLVDEAERYFLTFPGGENVKPQ